MFSTDIQKLIGTVFVCVSTLVILSSFSQAFDASRLKKKKEAVVIEKTSNTDDTKKAESMSKDATSVSAQIQSGKELYGNTCLFCHGAKGKGARAPSLISGHWAPGGANDDKYMRSVIMDGREGTIMGAFKGSHTEEQVTEIMLYLRHEAKLLAEKAKK